MMRRRLLLITTVLFAVSPLLQAADEPLMFNIKRLSMESALRIAQASIKECRKQGVQVAVTVIDRGGNVQVVLRDVLAPDITVKISYQKAYTAMAFNSATSGLKSRFSHPFSVPKVQGLLIADGGIPITVGGTMLGGVGVSGAPSGKTDESCAKAGFDAVSGDLELAE